MSVVLGVDPGKSCGIACFVGRRLIWAREIRGDILMDVVGVVQQIKRLRDEHGSVIMAIELQFLGRGKKQNPKSLEALHKRRHTWEILAEVHGIPRVGVWPGTWQSTQLRTVPRYDDDYNKMSTHKRMVIAAQNRWPKTKWTHDMAAAALIGKHQIEHGERNLI